MDNKKILYSFSRLMNDESTAFTDNVIYKFEAPFGFGDGNYLDSNIYDEHEGTAKFTKDVTRVGDEVFRNCYNILTIDLPSTVAYIGEYAFASSTLTTINFNGTKKQWENIEKKPTWNDGCGTIEIVCVNGVANA